jgi:hypothetical protein
MYQAIVLGLGFLLLFGAAYLVKKTDGAGVIISTQTASTTETVTALPQATLEGTYLCDTDSGCQNPSVLTLTGSGEASMATSYDNGVEVLQEIGTWKDEEEGGITVLLTGTGDEVYPTPRAFSIRYASSANLSGVSFDSSVQKGWTRPVFRRQTENF